MNQLPAHGPAGSLTLGPGSTVLAFDVGGTDMKAALIDEEGDTVALTRVPTPHRGDATAHAVIAALGEIAAELGSRFPQLSPRAAGLSVPGYVDDAAGIGIYSENLGWRDAPLRDRLHELIGIPVAFGHDVRSAAEAEHRIGAAAGFNDVVVMTIGTGIAGAVFIDGRLHTGAGMAGEIGHSKVADGPACACGASGCLEAVASAAAIARRYTARTGIAVSGSKEVLERAATGDPDAREIWQSALDALALDLSHTVALLAPEAIIIGGGLAQAGVVLFEPLRSRLDALLTFQRRPHLLAASIGEDAGVIGTALRARDLADGKATPA